MEEGDGAGAGAYVAVAHAVEAARFHLMVLLPWEEPELCALVRREDEKTKLVRKFGFIVSCRTETTHHPPPPIPPPPQSQTAHTNEARQPGFSGPGGLIMRLKH